MLAMRRIILSLAPAVDASPHAPPPLGGPHRDAVIRVSTGVDDDAIRASSGRDCGRALRFGRMPAASYVITGLATDGRQASVEVEVLENAESVATLTFAP
jgi:hypothetical protein